MKKAFSGGALVLASMDDEELPSPMNSPCVVSFIVIEYTFSFLNLEPFGSNLWGA